MDGGRHAGANLVDFVLEPSQRLRNPFINNFLPAANAHFAFDNAAAGDHDDFGDFTPALS